MGLVHNAESLALRFKAFWGGLLGGFDSFWFFAVFFGGVWEIVGINDHLCGSGSMCVC